MTIKCEKCRRILQEKRQNPFDDDLLCKPCNRDMIDTLRMCYKRWMYEDIECSWSPTPNSLKKEYDRILKIKD
jgi:hypothetical protein